MTSTALPSLLLLSSLSVLGQGPTALSAPASTGIGEPAAGLPGWIIGCWAGERDGERFHERWVGADASTLIGVSYTTEAHRLSAFEFLRVVLREGRPVYVAQPGGAPPTEFVAASSSSARVVFENPTHDFPKRVTYERPSHDRLVATIDAGNGSGKQVRFEMRRAPCT